MEQHPLGDIYYILLDALCSEGEEHRQYILDALRLTFPPGEEGEAAYLEVLEAIHEEP